MATKLISHEVPLELMLNHQDSISNYLYILLHIAMKDETYLQYAIDYKKAGGIVYLDNSCFELGESLDSDVLYEYYKKIEPDVLILPDKLGYKDITLDRSYEFLEKYPDVIERAMPVIQGNSPEEMMECYLQFNRIPNLNYIAIPFVYSWVDKDPFKQSSERVRMLSNWESQGYINKDVKHHLLGTWLPQEFMHYQSYDWVYSVDTSSPIMSAIEGTAYTHLGLQTKPKTNLDKEYNKLTIDIDMDLLYNNVKLFEYFVNGDMNDKAESN